jgi:transposase
MGHSDAMEEQPPPLGIPPADWEATPASVRALLLALLTRLRDLEASLAQTSRNSSKPPSSDPPSAPPRPPKVPRGRKAGAQPGHPGATRPAPEPDQISETIELFPTCCPDCQLALAPDLPDVRPVVTTYVWELPLITPQITAYRHHTVACPQCHTHLWLPTRPAGAPPGSFGPRLTAAIGLLHGAYHLSTRKVQTLCAELLGIDLSLGSVSASCLHVSAALEPVDEAIQRVVQAQPVANVDETSWPEGRKRCWLWTMTTPIATSMRILRGRSQEALRMLLGKSRAVIGSDRYQVYRIVPDERRQLCWSHLERNFQALAEYQHPDSDWARPVLGWIDELFAAWHRFRAGESERAGLEHALQPIQTALRCQLESGQQGRWHRIQAVSDDLLRHWEALWTFVRVEGVEPTNNAAERVLRPAVIARKLSFGTQSEAGSRFLERLLSVVVTARQQARPLFDFLTAAVHAAWTGQPAPVLVAHP